MFEFEIIIRLKYFIMIIIVLKLLTIIISYIKYRKLGFLHTIVNKITGIIIFIGFCIFILFGNTIVVEIGLYFSIISSLEELVITLIGKKTEENIKGIYEINKFKK